MAVAFVKEESAETAAETQLPDREIPKHPNLVTEAGLKALEQRLEEARSAVQATLAIEDVNERRRQAAVPSRDMRYYAARVASARVVAPPETTDTVAFGSVVTLVRDDGRTQTFRIVGDDEADPAAGTISHASPLGRLLFGKAVGDAGVMNGQEIEITAIV